MDEKNNDVKRKYSRTLEAEKSAFLRFFNRTVRKIIVLNQENVNNMPHGRMIVCCTHRSHLDYIILGLKIPEFGADQIRFAAGDNLTRIPMLGKLFRSVGAFSVYRGRSSQKSYITRLADQIKLMVASGDSVIVFPEGGRSYSGRMLDIKSGILAAGVLAQKDDAKKSVYYLPLAINYTKIPDLRAFSLLLTGRNLRDNKKNAFLKFSGTFIYYFADVWVFLTSWIFNIRTDVVLNVGKPTALSEITDVENKFSAAARSPIVANRDSINECSQWVGKQLNRLFPILPINAIAYLLDNFGVGGCNEKNLEKIIKDLKDLGLYVNLLEADSAKNIIKDGIKALKENGVIRKYFRISIKRKKRLKYFADFINSYFNENGE
ncbi:MAG: 1-acyl-sn-glycerol-3-phosphate acyltransferase [Chitinispirillales bacterium]|nr:1-acyl-sn-glycerol-3-phosphate acyltransferase [Chitinispirillales bacterium]